VTAGPNLGGEVAKRSWVEHLMGMPVSVLLRGPHVDSDRVAAEVALVYEELHRAEGIFSMFRTDSDVRRWIRRELALDECDPTVSEVVDRCVEAEQRTSGAFSAWRPGFDPTGLVKGWAVERAALRLVGSNDHDVCVNAGGDVVVSTVSDDSAAWRIGIENPVDTAEVLAVVELRRGAVATSGSAHRGQHIVDPSTGLASGELWSASVRGPSLLWADVYATAAVVKGADALDWLESVDGYEGLVVDRDGRAGTTEGFNVRPDPGDVSGSAT
jgi:thiamine biosynthesis lipoprotein